MWGKYFYYDGHTSDEFDLVVGGFNLNNDVPLAMSRDIIKSDLNRVRHKANHMGTKWSDPLSFNISMVKNPCKYQTQDEMIFTENEVDEIMSWLTSPDYPLLFHMFDYEVLESPSTNSLLITRMNGGNTYIRHGNNQIIVSATGYNDAVFDINTETGDILISYTETSGGNDGQQSSVDPYFTSPTLNIRDGYIEFVFQNDAIDWINDITDVIVSSRQYRKVLDVDYWITDCANVDVSGNNNTGSYLILLNQSLSVRRNQYDYFGIFTNIEPQLICEEVIGFNMTFQTNSVFAWGPLRTETFILGEENSEFTINVNSSERYREIYPVIKVKNTSYGTPQTITITALTDQSRQLQMRSRAMITTIDCEKCIIYDETTSGIINFEQLGLDNVSYIYWPRLYNGNNRFKVDGNAEITFQFREPRKVGVY